MNTRSLAFRMEYLLSTMANGGAGSEPSGFIFTRRGPSAPRCSQTEAEPGPPLKQKVTGRAAGFVRPTRV